ncbi:MAG: tetratricopeptide repeat protein [Deltaproteobacteria bacterium]|nr:tetratricopeptide repeat protein [Candidatus Tharpella aukensis]
MNSKKNYLRSLGIMLILISGVLIIYWQVIDFTFVSFDDPDYVYENEIVRQGLNWLGIKWAFSSFHAANWHPLTWLSHMLDVSWFGLDAGYHHFMSMGWHLANTLLLFTVLWRMTGALGRSALVAALFAWHPLRVESVAWIAERKDLLCVFFWFLTLLSYHYYTLRPGFKRYLPVMAAAALALLAKPMAVTLPFLLLVLDFWPLKRLNLKSWRRLSLEKVPLLGLAAASAIMTMMAQNRAGALASIAVFSYGQRLANALISYLKYIELTFWPRNLAVFYRYQGLPSLMIFFGGLSLFVLLTWWSFRQRHKAPFLLVGWLWFLGTLVPVIGLIQVGGQALADRYTYFPGIGLGLILVWGLARWCPPTHSAKVWVAALLMIMLLIPLSYRQTGYWRNSFTLFSRAVAVDPLNYNAYSDLGVALQAEGRWPEAFKAFTRAVAIKPDYLKGLLNLGIALKKKQHYDEADKIFAQALKVDPASLRTYIVWADSKAAQGALPEGLEILQKALVLAPEDPALNYNLGVLLLKSNQVTAALKPLRFTLRLQPDNLKARVNLGVAEARLGRYDEAMKEFRRVLQSDPDHSQARYNLQQLERLSQ